MRDRQPDEFEVAVRRLLNSGSSHLGALFADFGDEVDLNNPTHRSRLKFRLTALAVDRGWIPAPLQHHFTLLELVECVEAGQRPWDLFVSDLVADASGLIRTANPVAIKALVHDSGLPVDHLLWP